MYENELHVEKSGCGHDAEEDQRDAVIRVLEEELGQKNLESQREEREEKKQEDRKKRNQSEEEAEAYDKELDAAMEKVRIETDLNEALKESIFPSEMLAQIQSRRNRKP